MPLINSAVQTLPRCPNKKSTHRAASMPSSVLYHSAIQHRNMAERGRGFRPIPTWVRPLLMRRRISSYRRTLLIIRSREPTLTSLTCRTPRCLIPHTRTPGRPISKPALSSWHPYHRRLTHGRTKSIHLWHIQPLVSDISQPVHSRMSSMTTSERGRQTYRNPLLNQIQLPSNSKKAHPTQARDVPLHLQPARQATPKGRLQKENA